MKERKFYFDNLKFFLIFLVVLGHILTRVFGGSNKLYLIIYTFHIPVFMFISGYFARFKFKRLLTYILGFLVCKGIIVCLEVFLNHKTTSLYDFFINIDWAEWYFYVLVFYILIIALLDKIKSVKIIGVIFIASLILSFITPYFEYFSYEFSSARFFAFLPFYLCGYLLKRTNFKLSGSKRLTTFIKIANIALVVASIIFVICTDFFTNRLLFGAYSYSKSKANIWLKLLATFIAFNYILFFVYTARIDKKIPLITSLGQNTMLVYVMHSVVVLPIEYFELINFNTFVNYVLTILISLLTVLVFGNKLINKPLNKILN